MNDAHRLPLFETRFLSDGPQEFPRPNPILRTLLRLVTCVPCIIAVCIVAVEVGVLVRGAS